MAPRVRHCRIASLLIRAVSARIGKSIRHERIDLTTAVGNGTPLGRHSYRNGEIRFRNPGTLWIVIKDRKSSVGLGISEWALIAFASLVVIGLIGEHKRGMAPSPIRSIRVARGSWVRGEMVADGGVFLFSRHLQKIADAKLGDATLKAGAAILDAAHANERAASANERATSAEQKAEGFRAQIAKAESAAAQARLDLAKFKAPRVLNAAQQGKVTSNCKKFPKTPYILLVNPDAETVGFLGTVESIVDFAGWIAKDDGTFGFAVPLPSGRSARMLWGHSGILVLYSPEMAEQFRGPAKALADGLHSGGIAAKAESNSTAQKIGVYILVGSKPQDE